MIAHKRAPGPIQVSRFATPLWLAATALLAACQPSTQKLDEASLHDGTRFLLKVVRYHENFPLHFNGEVFRVQCFSPTTRTTGHKMQDPGWVTLGGGAAIGSKSAAEVAAREREHYLVFGDDILVWLGTGVNVSFDACGTFRSWYPTNLPSEMILAADKPDYCAPKGKLDCRNYDFAGDRAPRYEAVGADAQGVVSFLVRSSAFKGNPILRVESRDFGRTWTVARQ